MLKFLRRYWVNFLLIFCIAISIIALMVVKGRIEYDKGPITKNEQIFILFQAILIICLIYISANWLFNKWKEYKLLKNEKLEAELINLKNQISPHFFFNTLNNLYGLIKKDTDKAQDFVLKLSDLMRYSIYSDDNEKVSITNEITYIKNYISLHQIRHFKNIDIQFKQDVESKSITLYPLLLIILVENAFKHGAEKLLDNAFIHLDLIEKDNHLSFVVTNNFEDTETKNKEGIGLKNLEKRLSLLYHGKYSLKTSKENDIFKGQLEITL